MGKYLQDKKTGQLLGSVGDGKTHIPQPSDIPKKKKKQEKQSVSMPDMLLTDHLAKMDSIIVALDTEKERLRAVTDDQFNAMAWPEFIRSMRLLSSQSWGAKAERYLINYYGWTKVSPQLNRGDATLESGEHVEIKVTILTTTNVNANFVQIRPFQDIDGYRMFVVDSDYTVIRFDLTKEQMASELETNSQIAHGTHEGQNGNDKTLYAIRFAKGSDLWNRWMQDYRSVEPVPHI